MRYEASVPAAGLVLSSALNLHCRLNTHPPRKKNISGTLRTQVPRKKTLSSSLSLSLRITLKRDFRVKVNNYTEKVTRIFPSLFFLLYLNFGGIEKSGGDGRVLL